MTFLSEKDRLLAVARRVEAIIAEIRVATDAAAVLDLQQRATALIAELPRAIDRGRLQERADDEVAARLRELGM
jgi:hypothetical protein